MRRQALIELLTHDRKHEGIARLRSYDLSSVLGTSAAVVLQALVDLYFFGQANPETDIESMLSSASDTFRGFILKGMQKVSRLNAAWRHWTVLLQPSFAL
jgi:hypothetical protein